MARADWASKLDAFLQFNDADILQDKGKVIAAIAKAFPSVALDYIVAPPQMAKYMEWSAD